MNNELNSREEMQKRLAYIAYVGCCCGGLVFGIRGILAERGDEVIVALILVSIAVFLKGLGDKHWEFARLARSFPMGCRDDLLSPRSRSEMKRLLREFHQSSDWIARAEIRQQLETLVRNEPLLWDAYRDDLRDVHPVLYSESQSF